MKIIGNKMYEVCHGCGKLVCLNKFLFGSLHLCTTAEEQQQFPDEIRRQYRMTKQLFDLDENKSQ